MDDFVGFGALNQALHDLDRRGYRRILVVVTESGWNRFIKDGPHPFFSTREVARFSHFSINPDESEILNGVGLVRTFKPDLILALGGGSAMDVAKMMKAMAFAPEPVDGAGTETITPSGDGPPMVAIATTAGSGSEATQYAVYYRGKGKLSLAHPSLRPEIAVVDPEMTYSLPPDQTAATGFDALAQAVESYWGTAATAESQGLARAAIGYILPNLHAAVHAPAPDNRYHMIQAAYLAGKAINITRTTMPHALAYHLTKEYGLPHGHAVAITVPYFFTLNLDPTLPVNPPRDVESNSLVMEQLFALFGHSTGQDSARWWRTLLVSCGLVDSLAKVGVDTTSRVEALVDSMNLVRMKNHPVQIGRDRLVQALMYDH